MELKGDVPFKVDVLLHHLVMLGEEYLTHRMCNRSIWTDMYLCRELSLRTNPQLRVMHKDTSGL